MIGVARDFRHSCGAKGAVGPPSSAPVPVSTESSGSTSGNGTWYVSDEATWRYASKMLQKWFKNGSKLHSKHFSGVFHGSARDNFEILWECDHQVPDGLTHGWPMSQVAFFWRQSSSKLLEAAIRSPDLYNFLGPGPWAYASNRFQRPEGLEHWIIQSPLIWNTRLQILVESLIHYDLFMLGKQIRGIKGNGLRVTTLGQPSTAIATFLRRLRRPVQEHMAMLQLKYTTQGRKQTISRRT